MGELDPQVTERVFNGFDRLSDAQKATVFFDQHG